MSPLHVRSSPNPVLNCFLSFLLFFPSSLIPFLSSMSPFHLPPGVTEWTSWFNIDHPGGNGDYERLEAIRFYYRERVCARPLAMEARTTDWVAAADTGEVVHSSLEKGFWCINKEQTQGQICSNYHVRFQCPPGRLESGCTSFQIWKYTKTPFNTLRPSMCVFSAKFLDWLEWVGPLYNHGL